MKSSSDVLVARASEVLSENFRSREAVRAALELVVPSMGDWCVVDSLGEVSSGDDAESVYLHRDPERDSLLGELAATCFGLGVVNDRRRRANREGEPLTHTGISRLTLEQLDDDSRRLPLLRALDVRSILVVPLMARGSRVGTLTLGSSSRQPFTPSNIEAARALGHRIALKIDNGRLLDRLRGAVRARERLLAVVSHDLRTPLSTIAMTARMAMREHGPGAGLGGRSAEVVLRNARRMERLIADLLDFSQMEAGALRVFRSPENLRELADEALAELDPQAGDRELALDLDGVPCDQAVVHCDRDRILQVITNLVVNAIGHTPEDGRIEVALRNLGTEVQVRVRDWGRGMPPERVHAIFAPYQRAEVDAEFRPGSLGLGLYISRGIIEAHGGRIWAESQLGVGSTFYFTLPRGR